MRLLCSFAHTHTSGHDTFEDEVGPLAVIIKLLRRRHPTHSRPTSQQLTTTQEGPILCAIHSLTALEQLVLLAARMQQKIQILR